MKNIKELQRVFLEEFPLFKSFIDSSQQYLDSEDTYKRATSSYLHQLFDIWISSNADSLATEDFKKLPKKLFSDRLPGLREKQNFLGWRDQDVLYGMLNTEAKTLEFMDLLHGLLNSVSNRGEIDEPL